MGILIRDVSKRFGDFQALEDINLEIKEGSLVALLGPSGSGKSTLLRAIAGLQPPDQGQIIIYGEDTTYLDVRKRNIGFVFQHYALFKEMTIRENIAFGLNIRKAPRSQIKQRVDELLALIKLEGLGDRYPDQLSGGQRQRVALARALAVQPRVLLLDEPFGALDAKIRKELRVWVRQLHEEFPVTTVFVTHDQEEAMSMSDRIAIMLDGHIEQLGDPETVYEHPSSAFVAGFIGRNNFWTGVATEDGAIADDGTVFIASRPEEDVPNGEDTLSAVRPECMVLTSERPQQAHNVVQATVSGISHFGDVLQYVVTAGDRDLIVMSPRTSTNRPALGDSVWCSWAPEEVYLFSARQAGVVMAEPNND